MVEQVPIPKTQTIRKAKTCEASSGRILGDFVTEDGRMVTDIMVEEGHAVAYFGGSKDEIQDKHMANRKKLIREGLVDVTLEEAWNNLIYFKVPIKYPMLKWQSHCWLSIPEKAICIEELIKEHVDENTNCIEVGVFCGKSLMHLLENSKPKHVFAIDPI